MTDSINLKCRMTEEKLATFWPDWHVERYIGGGTWSDVYLIRRNFPGGPVYSALKVLRTIMPEKTPEEAQRINGTAVTGKDRVSSYSAEQEKKEAFSNHTTETKMIPETENFSSELQMNRIISGIPNTVFAEDIHIEIDDDIKTSYLRMEYLTSIQHMMRSVPQNRRFKMDEQYIWKFGMDICRALIYCENRRIPHLGIKPSNLFIDNFGNFKIGDFPLAREEVAARLLKDSNRNEAMLYMAPEVFSGRPFDTRADMYSLGLVMYQLLHAGRLPFVPSFPAPYTQQEEEVAHYQRLRGDTFPIIAGAGEDIQKVIRKACEFRPEERYQNNRDLYEDLIKCKIAVGNEDEKKKAELQNNNSSKLFISDSLITSEEEDPISSGEKGQDRDDFGNDQGNQNSTVRFISEEYRQRDKYHKKQGSLHPVTDVEPGEREKSLNENQERSRNENQERFDGNKKEEETAVILREPGTGNNKPGPVKPKETAKKKTLWWIVPVCLAVAAAVIFFIMNSGLLLKKDTEQAFPDVSTIALNAADAPIGEMVQMESGIDAAVETIEAMEISFQDTVLEDAVLNALQISSDKLTVEDLRGVNSLTLEITDSDQEDSISSLDDLVLFPGLEKLSMRSCGLNDEIDYSVLGDLSNLKYLDLHDNKISDLSAFGNMAGISYLDLSKNKITDLSPIRSLTTLESLALYKNSIVNVGALLELTNLRELYLDSNKITDISPLRNMTALQILRIDDNEISDLTALQLLVSLYSLNLEDNKAADISPLGKLTALTEVWAGDNEIEKIDSLADLNHLLYLNLDGNKVKDLAPLKGLTQIQELVLSDNKISDITPLQNLTALTYLDLEKNSISGISSLEKLKKLDTLYLNRNEIKDISPLKTLSNLTVLALGRNKIEDVSPLKDLKAMKSLDLYTNQIKDISGLGAMTGLTWLNVGNNQISDLSAVKGMAQLDTLQAYKNTISDLAPLKDLKNLRYVELDSNSIKDVKALSGLKKLEQLYIEYNQVKDVSPLQELTGLKKVYLAGNNISDYSPLDKLTQGTKIYKESQYE